MSEIEAPRFHAGGAATRRRRAERPGPFDYARKTPMRIIFALTGLFLFAPLVFMVVYSFNDARRLSTLEWKGFTTRHYEAALNDFTLVEALTNSLTIAVISTLFAVALGLLTAIVLWRFRFRFKPLYDGAVALPIVIPEICMGVSLNAFFWTIGLYEYSNAPWPFNLTTIILGHITFSFPFAAMVIRARLASFNPEMEEAATDLGASEWRVFTDILLPHIAPGLIAAALLAFALSLDDFVITFFTAGPSNVTFPQKVYSAASKRGLTPMLAAASTMIILLTIIATAVAMRLQSLKDAPE